MRRERLSYEADGLNMQSELFVGDGEGRRPAVLVFPEAFGLGEHVLGRAERLAGLGYVALASDLHGDGRLIDELGPAIELLQPMYADPLKTRARAGAGLAALAHGPRWMRAGWVRSASASAARWRSSSPARVRTSRPSSASTAV